MSVGHFATLLVLSLERSLWPESPFLNEGDGGRWTGAKSNTFAWTNGRKALEMVQPWEILTSSKVLDKQGKMFYKVWVDFIADSWTWTKILMTCDWTCDFTHFHTPASALSWFLLSDAYCLCFILFIFMFCCLQHSPLFSVAIILFFFFRCFMDPSGFLFVSPTHFLQFFCSLF